MHRILRTLACAGLALAVALPAAAQSAPNAKTIELAKRYVVALHMERTMEALMANLTPAIVNNIAQQTGKPVTPEIRDAMTAAAEDSTKAMVPRMEEIMAPVIAQTFTQSELQAAVTYYESAEGQSLLAKTPLYMAKATPSIAALMPELSADMQARVCRKIACTPAARP